MLNQFAYDIEIVWMIQEPWKQILLVTYTWKKLFYNKETKKKHTFKLRSVQTCHIWLFYYTYNGQQVKKLNNKQTFTDKTNIRLPV